MTIIATNEWLETYRKNKKKRVAENMNLQKDTLCEPLTQYFYDATATDIHQYLIQNGMFSPHPRDYQILDDLKENQIWEEAKKELRRLQKRWSGPDVPVFIFPSERRNRSLNIDFNGKSGLAFKDKLFLFVSSKTTNSELKALLTHEYNHVCRLSYFTEEEGQISLLDTIILEGMAECAVEERLGKDYLAKWTHVYSKEQAKRFWKKWIAPNAQLKKQDKKHYDLMFGKGSIPKWMGYNVGYHLVASAVANTNMTVKDMLHVSADELVAHTDFEL